MWYASGSGIIELKLTREQARRGSHRGRCDYDIALLRHEPVVRRQLDKLDPAKVAAELEEYGSWDETELADHDANLSRLLWLACCDIVEELYERHKHLCE